MMDSILYKRKTESVTGEHQFYFEKDYGFAVSCFYSSPLRTKKFQTGERSGLRAKLVDFIFLHTDRYNDAYLNFIGKNPSQ
jgi:hypothetical protein